jgi:tRNA modification GTPase
MESHRLILGIILDGIGEPVDEALAVAMHAPRSFTGEEMAELQCHGSRAVVQAVLDTCMAAGARLARPGEFSRRAFLNNRIDLAQAEALCDLVSARTELARRLALRQLRGGLSSRIAAMRNDLVDAAAEIEAWIDFPEEDVPAPVKSQHLAVMDCVDSGIATLLRGFSVGRVVREGARVVITGRPNAGKSSLFNTLVGCERAIVTPHAGTTRDTIESTLDVRGIAVTFVDTAGMHEASDEIERIGIERAEREIRNADLVVEVVDAARGPDPVLCDAMRDISTDSVPRVLVLNKCDLAKPDDLATIQSRLLANSLSPVTVSSLTREGIGGVEEQLCLCLLGRVAEEELQVASERHAECLRAARDSIARTRAALEQDLSGELAMVDLNDAIRHLGAILGIEPGEEVLDRIFEKFCLGK